MYPSPHQDCKNSLPCKKAKARKSSSLQRSIHRPLHTQYHCTEWIDEWVKATHYSFICTTNLLSTYHVLGTV